MSLQEQTNDIASRAGQCSRLRSSWIWFVLLGALIMAAGFVALGATVAATLASIFVFGILLLVGGIFEIVNALFARSWGGFFLHLLSGVLHLIVGELLIEHPTVAAEGLTILLAVAFLVGGILRMIFALTESFPGRGWVMINGFVTFLLGVMIWRQWPESSLWVIGLLIGIDLIFSGWSWVALGLIVKAQTPAAWHLEPKAQAPTPAAMA